MFYLYAVPVGVWKTDCPTRSDKAFQTFKRDKAMMIKSQVSGMFKGTGITGEMALGINTSASTNLPAFAIKTSSEILRDIKDFKEYLGKQEQEAIDRLTCGVKLKYYLPVADTIGEKRHPQIVMRALGIEYTYAMPQSIADQWWFYGCTNIPEQLPKFLTVMTK